MRMPTMFFAPISRARERLQRGLCVPFAIALLSTGSTPAANAAAAIRVERIRHSSTPERTRIVLDLSGTPSFRTTETGHPPAVIVELDGARFDPGVGPLAIGDGRVLAIRVLPPDRLPAQIVLDLAGRRSTKVFTVPAGDGKPDRLVIDVFGAPVSDAGSPRADPALPPPPETRPDTTLGPAGTSSALPPPAVPGAAVPVHPKPEPAATARSQAQERLVPVRPRVIVIDPGHGGHDPGARGPGGLREKDVCLVLAKAVAAELNRRPGLKAVLTRDTDVFLHLRQRTRIAAEHKADLFISIHANSSRSKSARGTEVYFLSLRGASDEAASEVAMRENAADHVGGVPAESQGEIEDILVDLMRASALERSSELAVTVIEHLRADGDLELRGVKQAGFDVLKTAGMPSILIETAFISHAKEAKLLKNRDFQRRFGTMVSTAVAGFLDRAAATDAPAAAGRPAPAAASPTVSGSSSAGS